jgi:hypothetical protein
LEGLNGYYQIGSLDRVNAMDIIIFVGLVGLHFVCVIIERHSEGKAVKWAAKHHYIVWIAHPAMIHGTKDFVIYLIVELPKHLGAIG